MKDFLRKNPLWIIAALAAVLLLAFPLRTAVQVLIITPLAFLFWTLRVVYRFIPQPVYWILLIIALFYIAIYSFYSKRGADGFVEKRRPVQGPVEQMAGWLGRRSRGVYFKWQVARLLALVALEIVHFRENRELKKLRWSQPPSTEIEKYLDAGLNTTFADYPLPRYFQKPRPTPFDTELEPVVDFLESQMEK